jgi:hypothetical protein
VTADKPTYLGLLNAISLAEGRAHQYLTVWAATTTDPDVRRVISTVALREGEHGFAFAKRIDELGFGVLDRPDKDHDRRMELAGSCELSDIEKFEAFGLHRDANPDRADIFEGMFHDRTIDVTTGALLGRYIAEERDTGRRLRACYQALQSRAGGEKRATKRSRARSAAPASA